MAAAVDAARAPPPVDSGVASTPNKLRALLNTENGAGFIDIGLLIKKAGSPEIVIDYLLKERQTQSQQNSQLWRLVDKQRGMVLGLNKDLERALRDKERYRKRAKDMETAAAAAAAAQAAAQAENLPRITRQMAAAKPSGPESSSLEIPKTTGGSGGGGGLRLTMATGSSGEQDSPAAESVAESSQRPSPIDIAIAPPYPITPPADQPNPPPHVVAGLLDLSTVMPKPQDHAFDGFDHEARDREADQARRQQERDEGRDLAFNFPAAPVTVPPRASARPPPLLPLPLPPPSGPPPPPTTALPTVAILEATPNPNEADMTQFPSPPLRKPPPAPLNLAKQQQKQQQQQQQIRQQQPRQQQQDEDTDSDLENVLDMTEITRTEDRGRRRTREEDDHKRQMVALREAEARSHSKKSMASASQAGSPRGAAPNGSSSSLAATMLSPERTSSLQAPPPLVSPGLPSSPRAGFMRIGTPPVSPRLAPGLGIGLGLGSGPALSPRAPRGPIATYPNVTSPLASAGSGSVISPASSPVPPPHSLPAAPALPPPPPNSPPPPPGPPASTSSSSSPSSAPLTFSSSSVEPMALPSPKPLQVVKTGGEAATAEPGVFRGLVTDEWPDLLLPPNALPSIQVKVASSRMKPSRASLVSLTQLEEDPVFTLAVISRSELRELWRVEKDSASLLKLDHRMKQCPAFTAKAPERSLFSGHAPAKLDARRIALDQYMDELVNTHLDVATALDLCRYLSTHTLSPCGGDEIAVVGGALTADTASENTAATGPGGRPFRSGYLTKRGKNFGGWKARYFVLEGPQLHYYESPGGTQLGRIKLQNAQIGKQASTTAAHPNGGGSEPQPTAPGAIASAPSNGGSSGAAPDEHDNNFRHAFLIMEPKKKDSTSHVKHVLCAESDRERDQWVDALLQWIDFKSSDDEEATAAGIAPGPAAAAAKGGEQQQERRGSAADTDRSSRTSLVKKRATKSFYQPDSDALIGVSYDSTRTSDSPAAAAVPPAHRRRGSASINENSAGGAHMGHQQPQQPTSDRDSPASIGSVGGSGGHPVGDAASWTSKMMGMGLAPPNSDDKRVKKRSFFGFGSSSSGSSNSNNNNNSSSMSKPRPSSDGQEAVAMGGMGDGNGADYRGPVKQVFGATLADAVRFNPPTDVRVPLPAVVYRCIQFLDAKNAILEEGIFRLSGSNVVIKALRERFNTQGDVNLLTDETVYDMHAVASLLKLYLRELPTSILSRDLHNSFIAVSELAEMRDRIAAYADLVQRLPPPNGTLLRYLIAFLIKIINHSDMNKMTVRNVGIVFSPTLNIPAPVFAALLQNYRAIFGIEPEEYDLMATMAPSDLTSASSVLLPGPPPPRAGRFENSPSRPSTAGNASPHRQRLLEAMEREGHPQHVIVGLQASRASPTPPLNGPLIPAVHLSGYEPQYMSSSPQAAAAAASVAASTPQALPPLQRPGYEQAAFGEPPYHGPVQPYEQAQYGSRRRESMVLVPAGVGLNPQGSRSRLREETRF